MIQYNLRSLRLRCFLFVDMCLRQVSFRSICVPRHLTSSAWVSCLLFRCTGGHVLFFGVKVTWADFVSFAFIRHVSTKIGFCLNVFAVWVSLLPDLQVYLGRQCRPHSGGCAVSRLCTVGREVGPTHCPAACRQIEQGEGIYIPYKITIRFILRLVKLGGIRSLLLSLTINPAR